MLCNGFTHNSKKAHTVPVPRERALDELRVRLPVSVSRTVDDSPLTNAIARFSHRSQTSKIFVVS